MFQNFQYWYINFRYGQTSDVIFGTGQFWYIGLVINESYNFEVKCNMHNQFQIHLHCNGFTESNINLSTGI